MQAFILPCFCVSLFKSRKKKRILFQLLVDFQIKDLGLLYLEDQKFPRWIKFCESDFSAYINNNDFDNTNNLIALGNFLCWKIFSLKKKSIR